MDNSTLDDKTRIPIGADSILPSPGQRVAAVLFLFPKTLMGKILLQLFLHQNFKFYTTPPLPRLPQLMHA